MGKKRKHRRRRSPRDERRQKRQPYDWYGPFQGLRPEDRLSRTLDYSTLIPNYDTFAAEVGAETFDELMDEYYFFVGNSDRLLEEPEFEDVGVPLDPHDFLLFETMDLVELTAAGDGNLLDPDGGYIEPYEHIILHAMRRYLTPAVLRDLRRRAQRVGDRAGDTWIGMMARLVDIALDDESTPPLLVGLLQTLFSRSILDTLLGYKEQIEREWELRDRSLDPLMEAIEAADFDEPAVDVVEELVAAGTRALPHLYHLLYESDAGYDDYAVATAFWALGLIPSQLSLSVLVDGLRDDDWASEVAAERLAQLPGLACPYLQYALTRPQGPDWIVALYGYEILAKARCPGAFELLVEGLWYEGTNEYDPEGIQVSASFGLVELGDHRAIPVLRDWLRDPEANAMARRELLYELPLHESGHAWADEVIGDLTPETLPVR